MSDFITIDGSAGEGGGQILRTSITLSMITGKAVNLEKIRNNRPKTGLLHQHLTVVQAAKEITPNAIVEGDFLGSSNVKFDPRGGKVKSGNYIFPIGTAGSTSLLFQSVFLPLLVADGSSKIVLEGGTHNAWSPPYDYLENVFLEFLRRNGCQVESELEKYGFYPLGGGRVSFSIGERVKNAESFENLASVEPYQRIKLDILCSKLDAGSLRYSVDKITKGLQIAKKDVNIANVASVGPGGIAMVKIKHRSGISMFSEVINSKKGRVRMNVDDLIADAEEFLDAGAPVDMHLADQLVLPYSLFGGGSFLTTKPTQHLLTNIDVTRRFLDLDISIVQSGSTHLVEIKQRLPQGVSTRDADELEEKMT